MVLHVDDLSTSQKPFRTEVLNMRGSETEVPQILGEAW